MHARLGLGLFLFSVGREGGWGLVRGVVCVQERPSHRRRTPHLIHMSEWVTRNQGAANKKRQDFVSTRHPALWGGVWLTRSQFGKTSERDSIERRIRDKVQRVKNASARNHESSDATVETTSPIFQGYEVVRRLLKNGASYTSAGMDKLLSRASRADGRTTAESTGANDVIVKTPFGRGRLIGGRVWDDTLDCYRPLDGSDARGWCSRDADENEGGARRGKKGVTRPENQVCDQFIVQLDWGNDGKTPVYGAGGHAYLHPNLVQFHIPGRLPVQRAMKISNAKKILKEASSIWERSWQTAPPKPSGDGSAKHKKVYLQKVFEAVQQYGIGVEHLHGTKRTAKYPANGRIQWGEPYDTERARALADIYVNLATCTNILGKDNIQGAIADAIFAGDSALRLYSALQEKGAKDVCNALRDVEIFQRTIKTAASKKDASPDDKQRNKELQSLLAFRLAANDSMADKSFVIENLFKKKDPKESEKYARDIKGALTLLCSSPVSSVDEAKRIVDGMDDARMQIALASVERNDEGDLKRATAELKALWSVKGSLLYKEERVPLLKRLREQIKDRQVKDKKNKAKFGKKFQKATKAGKRFGDDHRTVREKQQQQVAAGGAMPSSLTPNFLGGIGANVQAPLPTPANANVLRPTGKEADAPVVSQGKKKKKKKRGDDRSGAIDYSSLIGYGVIALGVGMIASAFMSNRRR